jgi:hypothetical protein
MTRIPTLPMPVSMSELSPLAQILLVLLMRQLSEHGNGAVCLSPRTMQRYGWWHGARLQRARHELIRRGYIAPAREHRRGTAVRYACTWLPVEMQA